MPSPENIDNSIQPYEFTPQERENMRIQGISEAEINQKEALARDVFLRDQIRKEMKEAGVEDSLGLNLGPEDIDQAA